MIKFPLSRRHIAREKSPSNRRWRLLQIESSLACNLRCLMCPWKTFSRQAKNGGLMAAEVWHAIRPYLSSIASIDFTGGGEPLLQPDLMQWVEEANLAGCQTGILTNGLLMAPEKTCRLIEAGIDWVCISMDGADKQRYEQIRIGSNFERVCKNIAAITRLRKGKHPKVMLNFVMMSLNFDQLAEMVELAARLQVDQINFKQCDVIRGRHGSNYGLFAPSQTKEIRKIEKSLSRMRRLAGKHGIHITSYGFLPVELPVCDQDPRDSMFVRYDGRVSPCINLAMGGTSTFLGKSVAFPEVHYGTLPLQDLMDLWQTRDCRLYRENFASRVKAYDQTVIQSLVGGSAGRQNAIHKARAAMPPPLEGCEICHYLYNI